ncbi:MAG: hypothetical protein KIT67_15735 [Alphaproteobacteria bacterium]|nr:hypothetical protein [Alphaproteobacteria bacterium]
MIEWTDQGLTGRVIPAIQSQEAVIALAQKYSDALAEFYTLEGFSKDGTRRCIAWALTKFGLGSGLVLAPRELFCKATKEGLETLTREAKSF